MVDTKKLYSEFHFYKPHDGEQTWEQRQLHYFLLSASMCETNSEVDGERMVPQTQAKLDRSDEDHLKDDFKRRLNDFDAMSTVM